MFKLRITGDLGFEAWVDIPGYEGLYQASTYGRIKSVKRFCTRGRGCVQVLSEKILNCIFRRNYLSVKLSKNGTVKTYSVHRLVAVTFLPNQLNLPCVNHKSEIKTENQVWNLEWCTVDYNNNYGTRISRSTKTQRDNPKLGKSVAQYDENNVLITTFKSTGQAARSICKPKCNIINCCLGKTKSAYGYKWSYV